jgi:hypothetical protein
MQATTNGVCNGRHKQSTHDIYADGAQAMQVTAIQWCCVATYLQETVVVGAEGWRPARSKELLQHKTEKQKER